jgi:L-asparagine transporter-like permease
VIFLGVGLVVVLGGFHIGSHRAARREVPKAVNAVIFRIGVFCCGSILLLCSMLPTSRYVPGISPFVTVFGAMGLSWMEALVQGVLIVAAMSSLNSGLFSTGRVLRSLGMSKQAPASSSSRAPERTCPQRAVNAAVVERGARMRAARQCLGTLSDG